MKIYAIWQFIEMYEYSGGHEDLLGLVATEEQAKESLYRWSLDQIRRAKENSDTLDDISIQWSRDPDDDSIQDSVAVEILSKEGDLLATCRYEPIEVIDKPMIFGPDVIY